jgi:hypothetical protein
MRLNIAMQIPLSIVLDILFSFCKNIYFFAIFITSLTKGMRMNIETDLAHEMAIDNILAIKTLFKDANDLLEIAIDLKKGFESKTLKEEQAKLQRIEDSANHANQIQELLNTQDELKEVLLECVAYVAEPKEDPIEEITEENTAPEMPPLSNY